MGGRGLRLLCTVLLSLIIGTIGLAGCGGDTAPTTEPATTPADTSSPESTTEAYQWPEQLLIAAPGQSGLAVYTSWASILGADIDGMEVRVIPEADNNKAMSLLASGDMFMGQGSKSALRNYLEALEDTARKDWGPFQARVVWVHSLSNSGFYVRGDSDIQTIYDIGPGTRFSVWDMKASTLNPTRSLLAWLELDESEIEFVDSGSYDGAQRAISEGRADVAFCFPTSTAVYEQSAAPNGIRFLDLNSEENPEGAKRWQERNPMYTFAPINTGVEQAIGHWGTEGYIFDITSEESDDDLVYNVAKWLDENYDRYKDAHASNEFMTIDHLMEALKTTYIPVHDGLIRYLDEKGLWTEAHEARQAENIAMLDLYIDGYAAAKAEAETQGIEITPSNPDWLLLWETYKVDHQIPRMGMHVGLTESGVVIVPTEVPEIPSETPASTETSALGGPVVEGDVAIEIVSIPEECWINDIIRIEIKTEPEADLHLEMFLANGDKSGFPKDPIKKADADGNAFWEWELFRHTPAGETRIEITATVGDKTGKITTSFIAKN